MSNVVCRAQLANEVRFQLLLQSMQAVVGDFRCSHVVPRSVVLLQCYSLVQASPAGCASDKVADQQSVPKSESMFAYQMCWKEIVTSAALAVDSTKADYNIQRTHQRKVSSASDVDRQWLAGMPFSHGSSCKLRILMFLIQHSMVTWQRVSTGPGVQCSQVSSSVLSACV